MGMKGQQQSGESFFYKMAWHTCRMYLEF